MTITAQAAYAHVSQEELRAAYYLQASGKGAAGDGSALLKMPQQASDAVVPAPSPPPHQQAPWMLPPIQEQSISGDSPLNKSQVQAQEPPQDASSSLASPQVPVLPAGALVCPSHACACM